MKEDYKEINRKSWNNKVVYHLKSDFYDHESFLAGKNSLNDIELSFLGDVEGKRILHLQCHFGQDSISLARMGAKVTGVDLSDVAIKEAQNISKQLDLDAHFICCDIYDLPSMLDERFDIVFTSYGAIGWLPDMDKWASIVSSFLKPQGKLLLVEFHPIVWMYDDHFNSIDFSYFNSGEIIENISGTYADQNANIKSKLISWNHSLSEVMMGIINNDLEIKNFEEYDYSPYNCFLGCEKLADRKYQIKKLGNKIALVYALYAEKK